MFTRRSLFGSGFEEDEDGLLSYANRTSAVATNSLPISEGHYNLGSLFSLLKEEPHILVPIVEGHNVVDPPNLIGR